MRKHVNIKVSGRVQGVFFRASTKTIAEQLGMTGFVRNEPDGGVYIEAEGDEDSAKQFVSWCGKGPQSAQVYAVDVTEGPLKGFTSFEIKR